MRAIVNLHVVLCVQVQVLVGTFDGTWHDWYCMYGSMSCCTGSACVDQGVAVVCVAVRFSPCGNLAGSPIAMILLSSIPGVPVHHKRTRL